MSGVAGAGTHRVAAAAAGALALALALTLSAAPAGVADEHTDAEAAALLGRARVMAASPHSGSVTVVSFTDRGPRVAQLAVEVEGDEVRLRRPTVVILDPDGETDDDAVVADVEAGQTVPTSPLGLEVDVILDRWDVTVGRTAVLDTGPAVPLHLVRARGTAVRETIFLDEETGVPVRRETRDADGRVLRVVAYTQLTVGESAGVAGPDPGSGYLLERLVTARTGLEEAYDDAVAAGFDVARDLGAGFELVTVDRLGRELETAVARYTDGLSVLSVYQVSGSLDPDTLEGAEIHHVAGRDVWTWPGREPLRYVWTGDSRTWTAVSDAPAPVIEGALEALPGDLVGHDATHRLRRGLDRVWELLTSPLR